MAENLYCPGQMGTSASYRQNYEQIRWDVINTSDSGYECPVCTEIYPDLESCRKHIRECNTDRTHIKN